MTFYFYIIGQKKNFPWVFPIILKKSLDFFSFDNYFRISNKNNINLKTKRFIGHKNIILHLCESKKSNIFISCSNDKTIKFWDKLSTRLIRTIEYHFDISQKIELSLNSQAVISIGKKSILIWSTNDGNCIYSVGFFSGLNFFVKLIENSDIFYISKNNETINLFDLRNGNIIEKILIKKPFHLIEIISLFCFVLFSKNFFFFAEIDVFGNLKNIFQFHFKNLSKFPKSFFLNKHFFFKGFQRKGPFSCGNKGNVLKFWDLKTRLLVKKKNII